ncbi:MAG: AAA family ATPase [Candidatus Aenigmarchaeota archaeon]|nr:AAA family ATPase [Candidatus Aenigmarchaeota archaeon]
MLLRKYEPMSLKDFAGNRQQAAGILRWVKNWKKGKGLLLYGPPGVGKSLSVKLIAKELGCELVESYASDIRSASAIKETLLKAAKQRSIFYKKKLFVIDDAEALDSAAAIKGLVQESEFPVIVIATDAYEQKLRALRECCVLVKYERIAADDVEYFLRKVAVLEKMDMEMKAIRRIAVNCNGDLRAAIIDLFSGESRRDFEENIFAVMRTIFKTKSISAVSEAMRSAGESVIPWLQENIANEYRSEDEIAAAYDYLSKSDLFSARIIKRQSWSLQKFAYDLAAFGVSLSKKKAYAGFTRYQPPRRFYAGKGNDALEKIASALGTSRKKARSYIPLVSALLRKNAALAEKFSLEEGEAEEIISFSKKH